MAATRKTRRTELGFEIASVPLVVEGDDDALATCATVLGPFQREPSSRPAARLVLRPERRDVARAGSQPLVMHDGRTVGRATLAPARVDVYYTDPVAVVGGLRLLLTRAFHPPRFLLVHGSAMAVGDRALLALGVSGAGKSTLATLFTGARSLSDELVLVEVSEPPRLHATPIRSSAPKPIVPGSAQLVGLLGLDKAEAPALTPLRSHAALELLLGQCFRHPDVELPAQLDGAASLVERVTRNVLSFRKDDSCVPLLLELLRS